MSDTPRVDEFEKGWPKSPGRLRDLFDLARTLERELSAATARATTAEADAKTLHGILMRALNDDSGDLDFVKWKIKKDLSDAALESKDKEPSEDKGDGA